MRTANNLLLLSFCVTNKEADDFFYVEFKSLKKYLKRQDLISIVKAVRSNPRAYSDTGSGITYLITESNPSVHSVQWCY